MIDPMLLVAVVRRARQGAVAQTLRALNLPGWTQSEVTGHGQAAGGHSVEHVRFEILIPGERADECLNALASTAHTGGAGDGILFTTPVHRVLRVRDAGPSAGTQA